MKQYRLKKDIICPVADIPKGTLSIKSDDEFVTFRRPHNGAHFNIHRSEWDNWVEEVPRVDGACFTHEDLREAFEAGSECNVVENEKLEFVWEPKYKTFEEYLGSRSHSRD